MRRGWPSSFPMVLRLPEQSHSNTYKLSLLLGRHRNGDVSVELKYVYPHNFSLYFLLLHAFILFILKYFIVFFCDLRDRPRELGFWDLCNLRLLDIKVLLTQEFLTRSPGMAFWEQVCLKLYAKFLCMWDFLGRRLKYLLRFSEGHLASKW